MIAGVAQVLDHAGPVDVALNEVAAEPCIGAQRPLQVDLRRACSRPSELTRPFPGTRRHGRVGVGVDDVRQTPLTARLSPTASSPASAVARPMRKPRGSMRRRNFANRFVPSPVNIGLNKQMRPASACRPSTARSAEVRRSSHGTPSCAERVLTDIELDAIDEARAPR